MCLVSYLRICRCVSSLAIKWRRLFSREILFKTCTTLTALSFLPSFIWEILRPSRKGFLVCSAITAYSFFLFSFQVRLKSTVPWLKEIIKTSFTLYLQGFRAGSWKVNFTATIAYDFAVYGFTSEYDTLNDGQPLEHVSLAEKGWSTWRVLGPRTDIWWTECHCLLCTSNNS